MTDELLTVAEAATYLKVTRAAIYEWIKRGELSTERAGTLMRLRRSVIDAWLKRDQGVAG